MGQGRIDVGMKMDEEDIGEEIGQGTAAQAKQNR